MSQFYFEGKLFKARHNTEIFTSETAIKRAFLNKTILEQKPILYDNERNLVFDFGGFKGIMPFEQTAKGITEQTVKEVSIISRVGKPTCFCITEIFEDQNGKIKKLLLSRKLVQNRCFEQFVLALDTGDIIDGRITHIQNFGCFVDIGCGITALLPTNYISVSRISHPSDRFSVGDEIKCIVKSIDDDGRIVLTHKELLGTFEQNISMFSKGETVCGIIRSVESYGVFIELTPNLAGLSEPFEGAKPGLMATVYIKSISTQTMKVKLAIVDVFEDVATTPDNTYHYLGSNIKRFVYSPQQSVKLVETVF